MVREEVRDAQADRGWTGHPFDLGSGEEADIKGLITSGEEAAEEVAGETDGKLLADLAVGVGDDVV